MAESGSGGTGKCIESPEDGSKACFGRSGSVTRITRHSQRVLTGLPSLADKDGVAASGPVDLGFSGWTGYLLDRQPGRRHQHPRAAGTGGGPLRQAAQGRPQGPHQRGRGVPARAAGARPPDGTEIPPQAVPTFESGFTNIIDIAFDKRGRLYVLEIATEGLLSAPEGTLPVGRLVRVEKNGHRTTLAQEGLNAPGGFVLGHGAAYITNNSILSVRGRS